MSGQNNSTYLINGWILGGSGVDNGIEANDNEFDSPNQNALNTVEAARQVTMPQCILRRITIHIFLNDNDQASTYTIFLNGNEDTSFQASIGIGLTGVFAATGSISLAQDDLLTCQWGHPTAGTGDMRMRGTTWAGDSLQA